MTPRAPLSSPPRRSAAPFSARAHRLSRIPFPFFRRPRLPRLRLRLGNTGLDFDRDYGCARRTGWTAVRDGCCLYPHLTSFPRAVAALLRSLWRHRGGRMP